jgi:hypothetical protein
VPTAPLGSAGEPFVKTQTDLQVVSISIGREHSERRFDVVAHVHGALALHGDLLALNDRVRTLYTSQELFTVTHIPTGFCFKSGLDRVVAEQVFDALCDLTDVDWLQITGQEVDLELQGRIKAAIVGAHPSLST